MRKFLASMLAALVAASASPAFADKRNCQKELKSCGKGIKDWSSTAAFLCVAQFNACLYSPDASPFQPFRSCTPGRGCRDNGDVGNGKTATPKPPKGKKKLTAEERQPGQPTIMTAGTAAGRAGKAGGATTGLSPNAGIGINAPAKTVTSTAGVNAISPSRSHKIVP